MSNTYDLDQLDTFVPFTFQGNQYHFYYPTLEETLEAERVNKSGDENKAMDFMFNLVKRPDGADYPEFKDVKDQMNLAQMLKFKEMIATELGIET